VEDWWTEAQATNVAISTYESYRNTMKKFVAFLGFDDAARVTPDDVLRFKDHRLKEVNPRTGKTISPKTVKDNDLAGLKTLFRWGVVNRRMGNNPADGITIKLGKKTRTRSKAFTENEAKTILRHANKHVRKGKELPQVAAAKRWTPWLCAYSGARIGEMVQLRKQDLRREGDTWIIAITPEAGTVKNKEAREVPLHPHLLELGFVKFVQASVDGYLFIANADGDPRGRLQATKNRVTEFVREVVTDPRVQPNHAWRHLFKTIAREVDIQDTVVDAICGHAPDTEGKKYGDVTIRAKANGMKKFPKFSLT
jgi:integrase